MIDAVDSEEARAPYPLKVSTSTLSSRMHECSRAPTCLKEGVGDLVIDFTTPSDAAPLTNTGHQRIAIATLEVLRAPPQHHTLKRALATLSWRARSCSSDKAFLSSGARSPTAYSRSRCASMVLAMSLRKEKQGPLSADAQK